MSCCFFFCFWRQLFHLFLADWGFPSLGIKQFQAGCGTAPTIIFSCFFLRQKIIYLLMDSASLAQSQAHWSKRGLGCAPCCSLSHCLFLSVSLPPSYRLYLEILSPIPSQWSLICYFFTSILNSAMLLSRFPTCTPSLSSPVLRDPPLFQLFSRGCPNPLFSVLVHTPFQKSSEETLKEQVYKPCGRI